MTSTQVFKSRGVGTAGAQTYKNAYSGWTPKSAVYLSGPDPGHIWWFGHDLYGAKDIRPLGGDCYEIAAFYVMYYPSRQTTTSSASRTTRLTSSATASADTDSATTATTDAPSSTTTSAPSTTTTMPFELTVSRIPKYNQGVFTGTVYTDALDNSTFAVICPSSTYSEYNGTSTYYIFAFLAVVFVGTIGLTWYLVRIQRRFWSGHTATITVGPGGGRQVVVESTDPQHFAMLQQQQQQQQPIYATTSPNRYSGYGRLASALSGSYPVYGQSQNNAGLSAPAQAYGYGQQNYGQQNYGQQNSMPGNQQGNNFNVLYSDPPPAGSTYSERR
ncbi:hypothetical protein BJ741DRAFT_670167 [Chytriomyces cf. hyalinus JEL632]|nr:hypothetical protein BJ741DRAFT_670167 [Chytriomyces cf. hyalinus JEL632]